MTISYKWLLEYLPVELEPEKLSRILNSIGLEVESLEKYEEVKGGLKGLLIGEVLEVQKHPNADKLSLTKVNTGERRTPVYRLWRTQCGGRTESSGGARWDNHLPHQWRTIDHEAGQDPWGRKPGYDLRRG